ncbi:TetR/AcrR family transcriptional regulator [Paludibacterium denitrificans]|uniref:TetR family transcriptional regulator n=1 Tax=Paludibacterium denitrificans TaxID=2675226 RepID=A0A844GFF6_9NEIS|nr:TetR/AcrR family transcriptional regulator [Paludibacterium denitrificans]MTD33265.1 TetR family transcriptional regulator [Paludibacterium denitrificans]
MNTADQIVTAALHEFYGQGFHATGVDQLSSAADVTKRTLYRHFPSKDHLIDAALHLRDAQFFERMQCHVEAMPVTDRLMAYLSYLESWGKEAGFHGCTFINAAAEYADHDAAPHVIANMHKQRVRDYLRTLCTRAGASSPDLLADQLFLIGEGLIVAMQVMGCSEPILRAAKRSAAALLQSGSNSEQG